MILVGSRQRRRTTNDERRKQTTFFFVYCFALNNLLLVGNAKQKPSSQAKAERNYGELKHHISFRIHKAHNIKHLGGSNGAIAPFSLLLKNVAVPGCVKRASRQEKVN